MILISAAIDIVFIIDIILKFHTGFWRGGILIMDRGSAALHYFGNGFAIDLLANFPYALFAPLLPAEMLGVPAGVLLGAPHMLRVFRLFSYFHAWEASLRYNVMMLRIMSLGLTVAIVAHWIACGWYFLWLNDGAILNLGWGADQGLGLQDVDSRYLTALYWSVTVLTTVGFGDIAPNTDAEMLFTTAVMMIGSALYAYVIGTIAALIPRLDTRQQLRQTRFDQLHDLLKSYSISHDLQKRVLQYHEFLWSKTHGFDPSEVLRELPKGVVFQTWILH